MRYNALPAAALLLLLTASPALAGVGLPKIASLQLGPHQAAIHNDSKSARVGSNTLTVEIPNVPSGHSVRLRFIGPGGQVITPELLPLRVLAGPEESHGDGGHESEKGDSAAPKDDHAASTDSHAAPKDDHAASTDSHAAPKDDHAAPKVDHAASTDSHAAPQGDNAKGTDDHGEADGSFMARAKVNFPEAGTWKAVLVLEAGPNDTLEAEVPLTVTYGGPNRVYVASSGLLIGGSILFGAIVRRRKPAGGN